MEAGMSAAPVSKTSSGPCLSISISTPLTEEGWVHFNAKANEALFYQILDITVMVST